MRDILKCTIIRATEHNIDLYLPTCGSKKAKYIHTNTVKLQQTRKSKEKKLKSNFAVIRQAYRATISVYDS